MGDPSEENLPKITAHRFCISRELCRYVAWIDVENRYVFVGEARAWIEENEIKVYLDGHLGMYVYVFGEDDAAAFALRWDTLA
jgi:hypothetical protein